MTKPNNELGPLAGICYVTNLGKGRPWDQSVAGQDAAVGLWEGRVEVRRGQPAWNSGGSSGQKMDLSPPSD